MVAAAGETEIVTVGAGGGGGGGAVTVMTVLPDAVASATLVAVRVTDPAVPGAVNVMVFPVPEMVPAVAVQVTPVLGVPVTVAVKLADAPAAMVGPDGITVTVTVGAGGGGGGVGTTVMVATPEAVPSALVAVTENVPAVAGATYVAVKPFGVTLPPVAVHVRVPVAPVTVAVRVIL